MPKNRYPPRKKSKIPPKGSLVRDLADWKSGDRSDPPQAVRAYVEKSKEIPLLEEKPVTDEDGW